MICLGIFVALIAIILGFGFSMGLFSDVPVIMGPLPEHIFYGRQIQADYSESGKVHAELEGKLDPSDYIPVGLYFDNPGFLEKGELPRSVLGVIVSPEKEEKLAPILKEANVKEKVKFPQSFVCSLKLFSEIGLVFLED